MCWYLVFRGYFYLFIINCGSFIYNISLGECNLDLKFYLMFSFFKNFVKIVWIFVWGVYLLEGMKRFVKKMMLIEERLRKNVIM